MKATVVRDILSRNNLKKTYFVKKHLKALKSNTKSNLNYNSKIKLVFYPLKKAKNRCIVSGRGKYILSDFKISRLKFSNSAKFYTLPGLEKASW